MDCNWPTEYQGEAKPNCYGCAFPQVSLLDEIHAEYPNAPFILMFRPVDGWIQSALGWLGNMVRRWGYCQIPGLYHDPDNDPLSVQNLTNWWCGHAHHVREFVKHHPSHDLIELDLYDRRDTAEHLVTLFGGHKWCWGSANKRNSTIKDYYVQKNGENALLND